MRLTRATLLLPCSLLEIIAWRSTCLIPANTHDCDCRCQQVDRQMFALGCSAVTRGRGTNNRCMQASRIAQKQNQARQCLAQQHINVSPVSRCRGQRSVVVPTAASPPLPAHQPTHFACHFLRGCSRHATALLALPATLYLQQHHRLLHNSKPNPRCRVVHGPPVTTSPSTTSPSNELSLPTTLLIVS